MMVMAVELYGLLYCAFEVCKGWYELLLEAIPLEHHKFETLSL